MAQCDQTSCQSIKAGFQMIYDQYLKGNLSLYITNADFSMRGLYTCECDGIFIRDIDFSITGKSVHLFPSLTVSDRTPVIHMQCFISDLYPTRAKFLIMFLLLALNSTVQIRSSESLVLDLETPDPVEVLYDGTGLGSSPSGQICTVDGRSLQCKPKYEQRSSLTSGVELRGVTPSDSGVYIIMDKKNKEVIHTYTVAVQGMHLVF